MYLQLPGVTPPRPDCEPPPPSPRPHAQAAAAGGLGDRAGRRLLLRRPAARGGAAAAGRERAAAAGAGKRAARGAAVSAGRQRAAGLAGGGGLAAAAATGSGGGSSRGARGGGRLVLAGWVGPSQHRCKTCTAEVQAYRQWFFTPLQADPPRLPAHVLVAASRERGGCLHPADGRVHADRDRRCLVGDRAGRGAWRLLQTDSCEPGWWS